MDLPNDYTVDPTATKKHRTVNICVILFRLIKTP